MIPVIQADREAAANLVIEDGNQHDRARCIRAGSHDEGPTVQAFARHRLSHSFSDDIAHRIADEVSGDNVTAWAYAKKAAKAAIVETTEAAARLTENYQRKGNPYFHTAGRNLAAALRNNDHLKGQP